MVLTAFLITTNFLSLVTGCLHPSLWDAYQDARFLPVKIERFDTKTRELDYIYQDSKHIEIGTLYWDDNTKFAKDFKPKEESPKEGSPKEGRWMVYYCSKHYTLYAIGAMEGNERVKVSGL